MILEAVYDPTTNSWEIKDMVSGTKIFEYTLDDVPLGFVIGTAVVNGIIGKRSFQEYLSGKPIPENELNEALVWFTKNYFPTSAMGRSLLDDIREVISIYLNSLSSEKSASDKLIEAFNTLNSLRKEEFLLVE